MTGARSVIPGAKFHKSDFHIHTPASRDWRGQKDEKELERLFDKFAAEGIEVVAITDHNSAENIRECVQLGKKRGIHVYPGVEISTKEGHVIAIFDPGKDPGDIRDWLVRLGITGSEQGNPEAVAKGTDDSQLSIAAVFKLIDQEGGVAIAPHPHSKKAGFLEILKDKGRARGEAYQSPYLRGLELSSTREQVLRWAKGEVEGYAKRYACVAGSDAHTVEEIGCDFAYIKLGDFGVGALKQALYDPGMRIRFKDEWPPESHAWIERVEVSQGFLGGIEFRFHPDMNCLVGGKAVGKSLLIELMKFALGVRSPIHEMNELSGKMIGARACLGAGGSVTLHVRSESGEKYRVQRTVSELDQGPEVFYEDTETKVGHTASEVFPCQVYSQNEVIHLGSNLPALLDWLDGFLDLSAEQAEITEVCAKVRGLLRKLDEKHALAVEEQGLRRRKEELEQKRKLLEEKVKEPILQTFPKWQQEERELRAIQGGLSKLVEAVVQPLEELKVEEYLPMPSTDTPNAALITEKRNTLVKVGEDFAEAAKTLISAVKTKQKELQTFIVSWRAKYQEAEIQYTNVIKSAGVKNASALTSELSKCLQAAEETQKALKRAEDARLAKSALEQTLRDSLMPAYTDCFGKIFKKRLDKASEIVQALDSFVKIRVQQMSDRTEFKQVIQEVAKGSGLRKEQCEQIVANMTPVRLAELIVDRDSAELGKTSGIAEEKARVFIENAWSKTVDEEGCECPSRIYAIMLTELRDTVTVQLKVQEGAYKPMEELSGGSKCTAILSVALIEGSCPLIVDQPEDALDSPFVFDQIVQTVRRTKARRQYIFATHNPNVAVGSDADLIYCLKATASRGDVDKHGSIDEVSTRDRVVANLEGGRSAFQLRTQKYDILVEDPNAVVFGIDAR
jgi:energy-coupling factor transporter ATP-binding protein EcfA2